jgi:hypothetical protein
VPTNSIIGYSITTCVNLRCGGFCTCVDPPGQRDDGAGKTASPRVASFASSARYDRGWLVTMRRAVLITIVLELIGSTTLLAQKPELAEAVARFERLARRGIALAAEGKVLDARAAVQASLNRLSSGRRRRSSVRWTMSCPRCWRLCSISSRTTDLYRNFRVVALVCSARHESNLSGQHDCTNCAPNHL